MNILITGANGFIGRELVKFFHNNPNNKVIGTSKSKNYLGSEQIKYISADLGDELYLDKFEEVDELDLIIHTAALIRYDDFDFDTIKSNCIGIMNISKLCLTKECKKIIYISSIPIIGTPVRVPVDEMHPTNPKTLYHLTKLFAEQYLKIIESKGVVSITLRIPSPIGPNMPKNKILTIFVDNCVNNNDISLYGEGKRKQNYIDILDIVDAVNNSISLDGSGVFNIAGRKSYSNIELANICKDVLKSSANIAFNNIPDPQEEDNWEIDTEKALKYMNFHPKVSIEESILKIAQYIKGEKNEVTNY